MKVTIIGEAVVITSDLKISDIKEIRKIRPEALTLKGGEDGKEDLFAIGVAQSGSGSLDKYGAEFSPIGRGEDGFATITLSASGVSDIKEWFYDRYGASYSMLRTLEAMLPGVVDEIVAEKAEIIDSISVVE